MTTTATVQREFAGRGNLRFSPNGQWAVSTKATGESLVLERWALAGKRISCRAVPGPLADEAAQALPLDDGRVLLLSRAGPRVSDGYHIALLRTGGNGFRWQRLCDVPAALGGYLLPTPDRGQLAFAVTRGGPEHSTISRLAASPPWFEPVMRIPGCLSGGVWLDAGGGVLALNQALAGGGCNGVAVDLRQRSYRRIWSVSGTSRDRIVLYSPRSGALVVTTNAPGEERLGCGVLGGQTVRFPDCLYRPGYPREPLALDDRGRRLLVHEMTGAVSTLLIYGLGDDRLLPVPGPGGTVSAPASWAGDRIRFGFSTPSLPPTLTTVRLGATPRWSPHRGRRAAGQQGWARASITELAGPAGPVEAIVYGGRDWRRRRHLVVALHGGPLSAWRFGFDPLFQSLAAAGIAVVAPNYRGSTGYGAEHLRAVIGRWGGPDADDVLHLARGLETDRGRHLPRPVVLGASYGAYLALLAACREPRLWSACVALAPFLSGRRLHRDAGPAVAERIEALGGLGQDGDLSCAQDVLQVCPALSVPLLLVHGSRDGTIPVRQSRSLRRRLLELGRIEGADFEYLEPDCEHTGVVQAQRNALRASVVRFCLARPELECRRRPARHGPGWGMARGDPRAPGTLSEGR